MLFFDFLNEYTFLYKTQIGGTIVRFVEKLAKRIQVEQTALNKTDQKSNYIINHSWNVLRSICETKAYIPEYLEAIEVQLLPIFEYCLEPQKIDFDDDVALLIWSCIKLSQRITHAQKTIFKCFEPIQEKYKGVFGNLLTCLNMYIIHNEGWLSESPESIKSIYNMSIKALFYSKDKQFNVSTNCDGAILIQLCLQYLKSPDFDDYFPEVLSSTTTRIKTQSPDDVLKSVLLGNYLSAFIYSAEATFKYLEQEQILEPVIEELFTSDCKMFHLYQRKLYLIALGQCLFSDYIPDMVSQNIVKIISKMILMLGRLNLAEKYKEKRTEIKENKDSGAKHKHPHFDQIFNNPLDDDEDDKIEDDLKEINDYYDKQATNGFSSDASNSDTPFKIINREDNSNEEEKEMEESKEDDKFNNSEEDSFSDFDEDVYENNRTDVEMEYDMLSTKVKDVDENLYFKSVILKIYKKNPEEMTGLINQLSDKQRVFMQNLLQTQKVEIEVEGETKSVHRRIVKARRRK